MNAARGDSLLAGTVLCFRGRTYMVNQRESGTLDVMDIEALRLVEDVAVRAAAIIAISGVASVAAELRTYFGGRALA